MIFDVASSPAEIARLRNQDLGETTAVVFDILRATSSMVTGFAHGITEIIPAETIEEARALQERHPDALLGGERGGVKIAGFDVGNSPLEYCQHSGRRVITTTTNGTLALRACGHAQAVLAAAFLNLEATVAALRKAQPARVLAVCAGTGDDAALEDLLAAGALAQAFPEADLTDAALAAGALYAQYEHRLLEGFQLSKNGRALRVKGFTPDVEWCAQLSIYPLVARLKNGVIRAEWI
ncbi:MAG: 2-phosphosulfolactate phosphatase [Chthoniobacteraceae bacterium]